jgi:DNA-binding NarL/FixJ family response regulator
VVIRIVIADDQAVVRAGFRVVLDAATDLEVVGEVSDGAAAAERLRPDVVLMDVRMPGTDGIEGTRRIARLADPVVRVLVVTTFDLDRFVYDALRAGAGGFVLKDIDPTDLQAAVRTVCAGHALFAPSVTARLLDAFLRVGEEAALEVRDPVDVGLTRREREVLALLAAGRCNTEIAGELHVSQTTVKTHMSHLLGKLGLRDRVQLVVFAYENGLVRGR